MTDDFDHVMGKDRLTVRIRDIEMIPADADGMTDDGTPYEEIEVFNHASVAQTHYVNSVNGSESYRPAIKAGDDVTGREPEAITERLARTLEDGFGWDREQSAIRVVDVTDDEVVML